MMPAFEFIIGIASLLLAAYWLGVLRLTEAGWFPGLLTIIGLANIYIAAKDWLS